MVKMKCDISDSELIAIFRGGLQDWRERRAAISLSNINSKISIEDADRMIALFEKLIIEFENEGTKK